MIERSFGTIVIRKNKNVFQVFLVKLKSGNHFGFPKGHSEKEENGKQTAIRELKEESNLKVVRFILNKSFLEKYSIKRDEKIVNKEVLYYLVEASGSAKIQKEEILEGGWYDFKKAYEIITYQSSKDILKKAEEFLKSNF